jgi:hypothetical protein
MESFSESVVSLSSEQTHRVGPSSKETSSSDEEEESLLSLLAHQLFGVAVDSSAASSSSSSAYLRLFSLEAIEILCQLKSSRL